MNIKLHVKWQEIDDQGTEDINYKKKFDQLEKTIFDLRLGMEALTNNFQATLESPSKSTNIRLSHTTYHRIQKREGNYISKLFILLDIFNISKYNPSIFSVNIILS